jgi:archaellum component FlaG (FlaF/FlaG flagellin family)
MKRFFSLMTLSILLVISVVVSAEEKDKNPQTSDPAQVTHDAKYEMGSIRVLVYEQVRRASERAEVYINDEKKGNSPVFVEGLKPGNYTVRVVAPKANWTGTVTIEPGKIAGVDVTINKDQTSTELYEILLWEDFLDNRNGWSLQPGSTIANGSLVAKTEKGLDYFNEMNHVFNDCSIEANFIIKQWSGGRRINYNGTYDNIPGASFGFVFRVKGSATILLFDSAGGTIDRYYLATFDDLEYFTRPIVVAGDMKVKIKDRFRVKIVLRHEELQIFVDGKLAAITQVKFTNEGNMGLAIGPGLKIEVENLTVGKV